MEIINISCNSGYGQNLGHFNTCPDCDVYITNNYSFCPNPNNFYNVTYHSLDIVKINEDDFKSEAENVRNLFLSDIEKTIKKIEKNISWGEPYTSRIKFYEKLKHSIKSLDVKSLELMWYIAKKYKNICNVKGYVVNIFNKIEIIVLEDLVKFPDEWSGVIKFIDNAYEICKLFYNKTIKIKLTFNNDILEFININNNMSLFNKLYKEDKYFAVSILGLIIQNKINNPVNYSKIAKKINDNCQVELKKLSSIINNYGSNNLYCVIELDPIYKIPVVCALNKIYDAGRFGSPDPEEFYIKQTNHLFSINMGRKLIIIWPFTSKELNRYYRKYLEFNVLLLK